MPLLNRRRGVWLLVFAAFCLLLWAGARWARQGALAELQQQARLELERYVAHLQGQLEKYEFLPVVLASNRRLVSLLQHPADPKRIEALNRYLETINRITGTSDTYLMDREGLTIAASNWQSERPFVGRNFSYRPYFKEAMKGNLGRYFALGTTSNKRGYYFAYPVRHQGRILGAVVIKLDLAATERSWSRPGTEFIVTDPDGVVFITTHRGWRFKTLTPLTAEVYRRIRESRRYVDAPIEPLPIDSSEELGDGVRLLRIGMDPPREFLVQEMAMPQAGWKVQVLSRTDAIAKQQIRTLAFLAILFIALLLLALFWNQRRKRLRERVRFERQAKRMLETRVQEQTRELQKAQDALIQSAKLAVIGQLSTGISHELNQPLAAIRTYADNARALLQRGRQEAASENLSHISELTERMARISSQLKIFARRTSGETTPVPLSTAIDDSLGLLAARLRETGTEVRRSGDPSLVVRANRVQLEQVLVNLIGNALHAVEAVPERFIEIRTRALDSRAMLSIRDSGPGIDLEILNRIFDPFFTTKEEGRGLGLGLSISQRIMEVMGGTLEAGNHPEGGAVFTLILAMEDTAAQGSPIPDTV